MSYARSVGAFVHIFPNHHFFKEANLSFIMAKKKSVKKSSGKRKVNWVVTLVMSIVFGWVGGDRFIMNQIGLGILKLITFGGCGIWWLVDVILIATRHEYKGIEWVEK